jgi:Coenzyme PQQ synthesis protein D (PqqD)
MPDEAAQQQESLLAARVRLPQSVVFRSFPTETVVLNLQTGKYHGLNPTAGRMLQVLEEAPSVREAAASIAGEYDCALETIEEDLCVLCRALLDRGLVVQDRGAEDNGQSGD